MRTLVIRIGRTVPTEFVGTVRAVWRRSLAVALESASGAGRPGPALVTLIRDDVPMTAASMALDVAETFEFRAFGLAPGDRVECDGHCVVVRSGARSESLMAYLQGASHFDGRPAASRRALDIEAVFSVAGAARRHRDHACARNALAATMSSACDARLAELAGAVRIDDVAAAEAAAHGMVGLGLGLTPQGDDALCGFMLGRRVSGGESSLADKAVARVASASTGRTSDVSAVELALAADGRFGEALLDVGEVIAREDRSKRLAPAIARCLAQGATSGADGLLGLAAGIWANAGSAARANDSNYVCLEGRG